MIKKYFITGDTHGDFSRFKDLPKEIQKDSEIAIIILGDAGLNFHLDERDIQVKNFLTKRYNFYIYCVRGNHEARPCNVQEMEKIWDSNVNGIVYYQKKWPKIRYFCDYGIYYCGQYRVAVFGGAYSVDKPWRLKNNIVWFKDELMTKDEMDDCKLYFSTAPEGKIDFIFSHTCPISWEPTELFLSIIDQSTVDKSMEKFLEQMKHNLDWNIWVFGHYHANMLIRPHVEMFYTDISSLDELAERWTNYDNNDNTLSEWWLTKSRDFYMGT